MRLLVVVLAVLSIAAIACGGSSNGGGGGGGSSRPEIPEGGNRCVSVADIAAWEGDVALLCDVVAGAEYFPEDKRNTVIYFGSMPPGETARVVLEGAIRASFLTAPEERFGEPGTLICAEGRVSIVDGVPQVFVDNAQHIVFLEEPVVTGFSCSGAGTN